MSPLSWTAEAIQLIKDLALWQTTYEEGWKLTGDPYTDNTMSDLDELIKRARDLATEL